jgi:GAF domain-containing protein
VTEQTKQTLLLETLVHLADTLVAGYDVADLLLNLVESCSDLLGSTVTGIMLADERDRLAVIATSDQRSEAQHLFDLAAGVGPCVESFTFGRVVSIPEIEKLSLLPEFRSTALEQGLHSVHAVPLRLRDATIGTIGLFRESTGELGDDDQVAAQALADIATIGILQERAVREADTARSQLQRALESRVVIEQAKGVVSYQRNLDMAAAFDLIRRHARDNRLGISVVAEQVVDRTLTL